MYDHWYMYIETYNEPGIVRIISELEQSINEPEFLKITNFLLQTNKKLVIVMICD